jgi:hypothetical protein
MSQALSFCESIPWYAWIPIVAIICGTVVKVINMQHRHVERLAMIQHGMDPGEKPRPVEEV